MPDPPDLADPDVRAAAAAIPPGLCDACVGRAFARLEHGLENAARGLQLRHAVVGPTPGPPCVLCEGIIERVDEYVELAAAALAPVEFSSFLVGSKYFAEVTRREQALWATLLDHDGGRLAGRLPAPASGAPPWPAAEWLKNEVNRLVGRRLEDRTGRRADLAAPDVVVLIDTRVDVASAEPRSVYVAGRYRKHARDIPQTRWPCRSCGGTGCRACGRSGKQYGTSVEEEVAGPVMRALDGAQSAFHGMGREDVDALMLGTGRPFVLEVKRPRHRRVDLEALAAEVNEAAGGRVEVIDLRMADGAQVARYKAADPPKSYVARCRADQPVDHAKVLAAVGSLAGVLLHQRTPQRVAHRRADKVRRRRVRSIELLDHDADTFGVRIGADSGTYIKELVSGDGGRTSPSLAERLGVPVVVEALDVVAVHWEA